MVKLGRGLEGSKARVQCDGLMMDDRSRSDTWPDIQIQNPHVTVAHEAVVGKISDEQLFYLQSRGITEDEARRLVVRGFLSEIVQQIGSPALQERLQAKIEDELEATSVAAPAGPAASAEAAH